ncbi:glycosyltransferase family 4 protein [Chroococcidiopsis sp. TS-821]|uniref:glycosyltransferase family 4 protein n=1 Tax=Chroococcidiopsis sp. TS-821 TaxID=1378066 RepID=UPI000CEEE123|nr:glycosyltransferase family 4 protein [Chroococcidiopsis sp. TS-821]PPS42779.1 glycosyl transferase family 1 [Chroococcidiopsis sp. TS-821]
MSNSRVLVAQLGARRHYQQPILFHQWGVLDSFYTDFYVGKTWLTALLKHTAIYNQLPNTLKKGLDRYTPELDTAQIIHFPTFGYQYAQAWRKASSEEKSRLSIKVGKEFCQKIIQKGLGNANVVYGFNGASLELFEYAKARGIRCILDQTVAERSLIYKLLLQEEKDWPNWSLSPFTVNKSDIELVQREQHEQDLADHIICGSSFVKDSLIARGVNADKVSVVPLGRCKDKQMQSYDVTYKSQNQQNGELKILFAGTVELRKGIPYLLKALRELQGKISFTCKVAGSLQIKPQRIAEYSDICSFLGVVPRSQMSELYAWADVFVLPSICEGSAMVTYEAMNWKLPIVTTPNAGSIVRNNIDGFVVPVKNPSSIANKLLEVYTHKINEEQKNSTDLYQKQIFHSSELKLRQALVEN